MDANKTAAMAAGKTGAARCGQAGAAAGMSVAGVRRNIGEQQVGAGRRRSCSREAAEGRAGHRGGMRTAVRRSCSWGGGWSSLATILTYTVTRIIILKINQPLRFVAVSHLTAAAMIARWIFCSSLHVLLVGQPGKFSALSMPINPPN